jgi:hypothetical protein
MWTVSALYLTGGIGPSRKSLWLCFAALKTVVRKDLWVRVPRPPLCLTWCLAQIAFAIAAGGETVPPLSRALYRQSVERGRMLVMDDAQVRDLRGGRSR